MRLPRSLLVTLTLVSAAAAMAQTPLATRWPAAAANRWYGAQPWLVGANYIPAPALDTAILSYKKPAGGLAIVPCG